MTYINGDLIVKEATIANALMIFSTMSSTLSTRSISFSIFKINIFTWWSGNKVQFCLPIALVAVNVGGFVESN